MAYPMGEAKPGPLRVDFDRRLKLEIHGSKITSDAGLLRMRPFDRQNILSGLPGVEIIGQPPRDLDHVGAAVGCVAVAGSVFGARRDRELLGVHPGNLAQLRHRDQPGP